LRSHYKLKSKSSLNAIGIGPMSFGDASSLKIESPMELKAVTTQNLRVSNKKKVLAK